MRSTQLLLSNSKKRQIQLCNQQIIIIIIIIYFSMDWRIFTVEFEPVFEAFCKNKTGVENIS